MYRGGGNSRGHYPREWAAELALQENTPSQLFPDYDVPVAAPPTDREKREVANYKQLRNEIHQGPFYTKSNPRNMMEALKPFSTDSKPNPIKSKPEVDPFNGVPTYSMKYDRKGNAFPQLSERPFNKELFPEELWSTLEGEEGEAVRKTINQGIRKRASLLSKLDRSSAGMTPEQRKQNMLEKLKNVPEDEVEGEAEQDDEEHEPEEEDYDYVDDEEEMGGDYDAEKYFDGGDGDDDDGGDGGGDDF